MRPGFLLTLLALALAACGADGPPTAPPPAPSTAVSAGVTVGTGGIQPSASIARTTGNVTLGIGFGA
jgi:predicted small lipoprotein YifL